MGSILTHAWPLLPPLSFSSQKHDAHPLRYLRDPSKRRLRLSNGGSFAAQLQPSSPYSYTIPIESAILSLIIHDFCGILHKSAVTRIRMLAGQRAVGDEEPSRDRPDHYGISKRLAGRESEPPICIRKDTHRWIHIASANIS